MKRGEIIENLKDLSTIQDERNEIHIDWLKTTLTIATALLAILVSFKNEKSISLLEHITYISTIILSGIGILTGLMVLYSYVVIHNRTLTKKKEQILSLLSEKEIDTLERVNRPFFYSILEYICNISLLLALISLISYGVIIDF